MVIEILQEKFSICKYAVMPNLSELNGSVYFTAVTDCENSLVCKSELVPKGHIAREDSWRIMRIVGQLEFSLVGIMAKIAALLAKADIPIFALSTYDTDYIALKEDMLDKAVQALTKDEIHIKF